MRHLIRLAILGAAFSTVPSHGSAPSDNDLESARLAFFRCMEDNTVRLGKGNQENAETILKAVRMLCEPEDRALGFAYLSANKPLQTYRPADREEAEGKAIIALLLARSK